MSTSPRLILALGLPLAACATAGDPENTATTTEAQITNIIATPDKCNQGVAPGNCVQAAPATTTSPRWKVDGIKSPGEYAGATQMPYVLNTSTLGGYGTVHVSRVTNKAAVAPDRDVLFVYLDDLAVPIDHGGTPQGKFHLYLDYARFEGADKYIAAEDRRIEVDLKLDKLVAEHKVQGAGAAATWVALPSPEAGLVFRSGGCKLAPSGKSATCDGELQIPLPASVLTSPSGTTLDPGMGLFVRHVEVTAGMPELASNQYTPAITQRILWETVVFGKPRGFPLKVMAWNVNRGDDLLFANVPDSEIGKFLARNDIVALQEVWDFASAQKIADAANVVRTGLGLPLFKVYGPIDLSPAWHDLIVEAVDWINETQGGLFVLTHLAAANHGGLVFTSDDCRGDDCFRAKGVQWIRLILNHPDLANPNCREGGAQSCSKPPSGDDYVDFFNVALQSEHPPICENGTWDDIKPGLLEAIGAIPEPFGSIVKWVIEAAVWLIESDLHCESLTSVAVRDTQLVKANEFIEQITSQAKDRPSIVAGDFNIDGRGIGATAYQQMLVKLRIAESATPTSDIVNQVPFDFDWDVDHGDLARERADINFSIGRCLGTVIGFNGGNADLTCTFDGKFDGAERTTYVFVRPHAVVSVAKTLNEPSWVAMKGPLAWASPFPSNNGNTGAPPNRLSDHKPVVADIQLAPWKTPAKYHPAWGHEGKLALVSVDGTFYDDCWGCGEIDPYADLTKFNVPANVAIPKTSTECTGKHMPSWPTDDCMNDWFFTQAQTASVTGFRFRADVREDDDINSNDHLSTYTESKLTFNAGGGKWSFDLLLHDPVILSTAALKKALFEDTSPYSVCDDPFAKDPTVPSAQFMARVCHRVEITETPPAGP